MEEICWTPVILVQSLIPMSGQWVAFSALVFTEHTERFLLLLLSRSVVSDSWQPHGLQPNRLLRPWFLEGWYSNLTTLEQTHLPISFQVSPGCRRYSIKNQHEELTYLLQIQTVSTRCMNKKSITWRDQGIQLRIAIMWSSQQISLVFLMV